MNTNLTYRQLRHKVITYEVVLVLTITRHFPVRQNYWAAITRNKYIGTHNDLIIIKKMLFMNIIYLYFIKF